MMCASSTSPRITGGRRNRACGSVLVPVVAAMLILLLTGIALSELFAGQRMQSVLRVESTQAHGIAEAGLWHAIHDGTDIATPVSFAGGSYIVTKSGNLYTATGTRGAASRVASFTFPPTSSSGPLDEAASAASAARRGNDRFIIDLINATGSSLEVEWFSLSADLSLPNVEQMELDAVRVWDGDQALPTGTVLLNAGSSFDRTIPGGGQVQAEFRFVSKVGKNSIEFTLVIGFVGGSSSTLVFTLDY